MAATLKVSNVSKEYSPADNKNVLKVDFEILDGETAEVRSLAFPLETTPDQLKTELTNYLNNYNLEKKQAEINAAQDAAEAQADETIAAISGLELGVGNAGEDQSPPQPTEQPAENQGTETSVPTDPPATPEQPAE